MSLNKKFLNKSASAGVEDTFNVKLYEGDRPSNVTVNTFGFSPDLVIIKDRDNADNWSVLDTTRGQYVIGTNSQDAEADFSGGFEFTSGGFIVKNTGQANTDGADLVSYGWLANGGTTATNSDGNFDVTVQANTDAGFSIITYTGQGSDTTYGHGLDSAPEFLFTKTRSHTSDWPVYHKDLTSAAYRLVLNSDGAENTDNNPWNSTAPTSSVISIKGDAGNVNTSGRTYVTYAFHSVEGYSKFGTYTGTGTSSRSFTGIGFQPDFVMVKSLTQTARWHTYDSARGVKKRLLLNSSGAEFNELSAGNDGLRSFDSDGWTVGNDTDMNGDGESYIYAVFKIN